VEVGKVFLGFLGFFEMLVASEIFDGVRIVFGVFGGFILVVGSSRSLSKFLIIFNY
jgi:hypothetical protein